MSPGIGCRHAPWRYDSPRAPTHSAGLIRTPSRVGGPSVRLPHDRVQRGPSRHARCRNSRGRKRFEAREGNRMKTFATSALIAATWLLSGCSSDSLSRWNSLFHATPRPTQTLKPYLLFDRHAGTSHASDFAARREWPSVEYGYTVRERILFTESTYDYQGRSRGGGDVRRRFSTHRTGLIDR